MRLSGVALLGAGLLLGAGSLAAEVIERDYHRTFDVERGHRLHLEHGDGDVVIEPWDQDRVDVKVVYRAEYTRVGVGSEMDLEVDFRQTESTVHVVERSTGRWVIGFLSYDESEYLYTIRAPAYLLLDIEGEDGDVEVTGWRGEIRIRTEDGDLDLIDVRSPKTDLDTEDGDIAIDGLSGGLTIVGEDGDVRISDCSLEEARLRLDDGDATFTRCAGSARFDLVDGDLALEGFRADAVEVRTEDGDVDLELLPNAAMNVVVRTRDGDITVDLADGASLEFTIDTGDGDIRVEVPGAADLSERRSSASGRIGSGEGRLRIESGDGRVVVRGRG